MKNLTLFPLSLLFIVSQVSLYGQCVKGISTEPEKGVNEEFLPLMNDWYPANGPYTVNSFENTHINWYWPNNIVIDLNANWSHPITSSGSGTFPMINPFSSAMPSAFSYLRNPTNPEWRDYHWEDGWELLWSNLGYYPNGDPYLNPSSGTYFDQNNQTYNPTPSNIPYFVLYNRYRGVMRLFANVWFDNLNQSFQDLRVTLRYTKASNDNRELSGLFRNINNYDRALDQLTTVKQALSPRFHPPNTAEWFVAEFQMAYDPCVCNSQGELEFVFEGFQTMEINMTSRSISVEEKLTESNYRDEDFLNLTAEPGDKLPVPGTVIYRKMDRLLDSYNDKLKKYEQDLKDYNTYQNNIIRQFVGGVKSLVVNGISGALPYGSIAAFLSVIAGGEGFIKPDNTYTTPASLLLPGGTVQIKDGDQLNNGNSITDIRVKGNEATWRTYNYTTLEKSLATEGKSALGRAYDFLNLQLFGAKPNKPVPPQIPVATFTESVFKGTISNPNPPTVSSPLLVPGTLPAGYPTKTDVTAFNYPAYNEVLGLFALLKTPSVYYNNNLSVNGINIQTFMESEIYEPGLFEGEDNVESIHQQRHLSLKLKEPLQYVFNPALDIDEEKTQVYAMLEIQTDNTRLEGGRIIPSGLDTNSMIASYQTALGNLFIAHNLARPTASARFKNFGRELILQSPWYKIEDLGEVVFSSHLQYGIKSIDVTDALAEIYPNTNPPVAIPFTLKEFTPEVKKIVIKIMADVYFDQIGINEEQVNTTQVFSFLLYDKGQDIDLINSHGEYLSDENLSTIFKYQPGTVELNSDTYDAYSPEIFETNGTDLYVKAEKILIKGDIDVDSGYTLHLEARDEIQTIPDASISPDVIRRINATPFNFGIIEEVSGDTVTDFCNDQEQGYKANSPVEQKRDNPTNTAIPAVEKDLQLSLYPNPSRNVVNVVMAREAEWLEINLVDLNGKQLLEQRLEGDLAKAFQIDMSNMPQGIYILRIHSSNGQTTVKQIVKQL